MRIICWSVDGVSSDRVRFDVALRSCASADPLIAFFDDRVWFQGYWGGRDARGVPAYRTVTVGDMHVTNTSGDDPRNAVLADGHAGLVWNVLWAKAMVDLLNAEFDAGIAPLSDTEVTTSINTTILRKRSEEHTSELQSLMRISYAVFCLKKKKKKKTKITYTT